MCSSPTARKNAGNTQAAENYDASKHNGFDVRKNPLMSGGHGKTFTNKPRFGRVKPGCGPSG